MFPSKKNLAALAERIPASDREWPRNLVGCNVTTCPNGKCQQTGECIDLVAARQHREIAERHESPPLVPCKAFEDTFSAESVILDSFFPARSTPAPARTLIAFTGLAGAGKSTAAAHLVKHRGFTRVRFAGPLKAMMAALGCTPEQVDGSEKEKPCELLGGKTPRHAMQTLGTEWGRDLISPDLWIRAWQVALDCTSGNVVVDDARFPNEAAAVLSNGGILVYISRPGANGERFKHSSEGHLLPAAHTLHNTLSERNLREQVDVLLRDLSWADRAPAPG